MLASSSSYKNLQCHLEVKMFLRGLHLVCMSLHKVADKVVRISNLFIRWKEECFNTLPVFIIRSSGEYGWVLRSFKFQYVLGSSSAQLNQNKKVPLARMRSLELVFSELRSNMIFLDFDISKVNSSIFTVFFGSPSSSVLIIVLKLCVLTWSLNLSKFEIAIWTESLMICSLLKTDLCLTLYLILSLFSESVYEIHPFCRSTESESGASWKRSCFDK